MKNLSNVQELACGGVTCSISLVLLLRMPCYHNKDTAILVHLIYLPLFITAVSLECSGVASHLHIVEIPGFEGDQYYTI